jgi:hypothetical protein
MVPGQRSIENLAKTNLTPKKGLSVTLLLQGAHYPNSNPDLPVRLSTVCLIDGLVTSLGCQAAVQFGYRQHRTVAWLNFV